MKYILCTDTEEVDVEDRAGGVGDDGDPAAERRDGAAHVPGVVELRLLRPRLLERLGGRRLQLPALVLLRKST